MAIEGPGGNVPLTPLAPVKQRPASPEVAPVAPPPPPPAPQAAATVATTRAADPRLGQKNEQVGLGDEFGDLSAGPVGKGAPTSGRQSLQSIVAKAETLQAFEAKSSRGYTQQQFLETTLPQFEKKGPAATREFLKNMVAPYLQEAQRSFNDPGLARAQAALDRGDGKTALAAIKAVLARQREEVQRGIDALKDVVDLPALAGQLKAELAQAETESVRAGRAVEQAKATLDKVHPKDAAGKQAAQKAYEGALKVKQAADERFKGIYEQLGAIEKWTHIESTFKAFPEVGPAPAPDQPDPSTELKDLFDASGFNDDHTYKYKVK